MGKPNPYLKSLAYRDDTGSTNLIYYQTLSHLKSKKYSRLLQTLDKNELQLAVLWVKLGMVCQTGRSAIWHSSERSIKVEDRSQKKKDNVFAQQKQSVPKRI